MKIQFIKKGLLEYIIIDDIYTNKEFNTIKKEIEYLQEKSLPVEQIDSAKQDHMYLKNNKSIWVYDYFHNNPNESPCDLALYRKIFSENIYSKLEKHSLYFSHIRRSTGDGLLINYYSNDGEYLPHYDQTVFTCITMFEIGKIEGGNLRFPEFNEVVKFKENRMVIFPGCLAHHAEKTTCEEGSYRATLVNFIYYRKS
jgi:hypothetical protein